MSRLTNRLERDLAEIAAGADPSPTAWASIVARLDDRDPEVELALSPAPDRSTRRAWIAAAAAAFVVLIGAIAVLTRIGGDGTAPTGLDLSETFESTRHGFSVEHPEGSTVNPATEPLGFSESDDGFDVLALDSDTVFRGASTEYPDATGVDELLADHLPDGCGVPHDQQAVIVVDGLSGRIAECTNRIEATVVSEGTVATPARLYVFTLTHNRSDARAAFDAVVATIELTPETASDVPVLNATFVSPTNGYTFDFFDRGGASPATEAWDPANDQLDDEAVSPEDGFDGVESGLGAYFIAASTELPSGVSVDDWADEHVTPAGCGVPRREQDEITIDGQPGRVWECGNRIEATVVAGGRFYLFALLHQRRDAREWFDNWIATVELTPETAR